ncbi:MAG: Asp-tRNA(Asn)/Glu-tRNA(Gln) amidotransferase subunit GatC [Candidatus Moraniibacteriota bacterium]|nr:MAG: Asp-tRNA(Asn)/Glu-tRNA(Gln) amidotransferase subunit GatC [Candidatus Moranbacteria bacterium]
MSTIDLDGVKRLAQLANLKLSDAEAQQYPEQLSESLEYVKNLDEVDTSQVPDNFFTTKAKNVMEEDEVRESDMLTPKGYFVVKRIL